MNDLELDEPGVSGLAIDQAAVLTLLVILVRVAAVISFFPIFARRQIPQTVKVALAFALSIFWFSTLGNKIAADLRPSTDWDVLYCTLLLVREVSIGLLIAMTLGLVLIPARIAGAYVGQEFGFSLGTMADPSSPDSSATVTQLFETLALLLFFVLNLHHVVIILIHGSFDQLGGKIDLLNMPTENLVAWIQQLNHYGLLIVAPVAIFLFALNLLLVFLNKAAPSLNLFSVGMTIRGALGLACLLVMFPVVVKAIEYYLGQSLTGLEQVFTGFDVPE